MRSEPARVNGTGRAGGRTRGRRAVSSAAAGSLLALAGLGAAIAGPGVAGAVNNNPPGNPTSPAVSYEADCTNSLAGKQVAPFVTQLDANTTTDTAAPTGATFGLSGTATTTLSGAFVANIESNGVGSATVTLGWVENIGSTDGNATGNYTYTSPTLSQANDGGTVTKVSWTSGSTTITGNFSKAAVGESVASSGAGFPATATITSITGKASAVISIAPTASASGETVGYASALTYTDPNFNTGNVFTTAGTGGGTAGVGVTSITKFDLGVALPLTFGGATGNGPANCQETGYAGYTVGSPAGPAQTGGATPPFATAPVLSPGSTTALVSASPLQFPAAAYVNLLGAPGAPTNVVATSGDSSAGLTWNAPSNDGGSTITGYVITPFIGTTAQTPIDVGDVTSDTVTGLTNGTAYTFTVAATNTSGTGTASAESNVVTPATVPGAPTNVDATAGNASATLTWDAPASDGGSPVTGYTITPFIGTNAQTPVDVGDVLTDVVVGLTNGTAYTFTVTATNAVGSGSPSAASNSVTPTNAVIPPGPPTDVVATSGDASASLTWAAPASDGGSPVTGYIITPFIGSTAQTPVDVGDVLTDVVTGLTNGTAYTFTVAATNTAGTGTASTASNAVTPATVPGQPLNVTATAGNASASVTWTAPTSDGGSPVTGYVITPFILDVPQTSITVGNVLTHDVTGLTNGTAYSFRVAAINAVGTGGGSNSSNIVTPFTSFVPGYWMVAANGTVYAHGTVQPLGAPATLNSPIVGMAPTTDNLGYWLVAADGGVFNYGNAGFFGSHGNAPLNQPVVGIAPTPDNRGYWLVAADGGVFAYGDATFYGSHGNAPLNRPVVGMAATSDGHGYWLVAADGGVFSYGDATFHGSHGDAALNSPVVGMAATNDGGGYWLVGADGGVFNYGDATFDGSHGNAPLNSPVVSIAAGENGGYNLFASDGGVFSYATTYYGSQGGTSLPSPIVGAAG